MVMELVKGLDLFDTVQEKGVYNENDAKIVFREIIDAIRYLHSIKICHRDIKPSNIMIQEGSGKVKLMDFNVSKLSKDQEF
jgi:serine/threonine protein kinase